MGADIVFHSATKYLAGHSDTIVGIAVTSDVAAAERLRFLQNAMGAVPGPLDCFLVLRGLRTLHLRMERHGTNAAAVAAFLRDDRTWRPSTTRGSADGLVPAGCRLGRPDRHGPSRRDRRGHAPVHPRRVTGRRRVADRGPGSDDPPLGRGSPLEVDPALVRLSVGIEGVDDLIDDLRRALDGA